MSKGKQTVPLSQIVDHATNSVHPSPYIKGFQTITKIATTIPQAQVALRVQLITKMKAYCQGFLGKKEMYYCLCLMDHLVNNCPVFRPQVINHDFVVVFERCGEFEKSKKNKKIGIVTEKALQILQTWGPTYGNELYDYQLMYEKYVSKGIQFPALEKPIEKPKETNEMLKEELDKITKEIRECMELINDSLIHYDDSVHIQSIKALHKRAVELNSKFNVNFVKYMDVDSNEDSIMKYSEIEKHFTEAIHQLANIINNPNKKQDEIYRTYTTGHINMENQLTNASGRIEMNQPKLNAKQKTPLPIQSNDKNVLENIQTIQFHQSVQNSQNQSNSQNVSNPQSPRKPRSRQNSFHLAPPPSKGQPLRISRQNTDENGLSATQNKQTNFAPKIHRTTSTMETESVVKNRFIFNQNSNPSNLSSTQGILEESLL